MRLKVRRIKREWQDAELSDLFWEALSSVIKWVVVGYLFHIGWNLA